MALYILQTYVVHIVQMFMCCSSSVKKNCGLCGELIMLSYLTL